jgi:[protein-PII] uridylyltransferase
MQLSPAILAARSQLIETRKELCTKHNEGMTGRQLCRQLTNAVDDLVVEVLESILEDQTRSDQKLLRSKIALVAVGGFGRRDIAPYSDIDLMLLHDGTYVAGITHVVRRLVIDLNDIGLQLGFSVRTTRQALQMARQDIPFLTSLLETRFLSGSVRQFVDLTHGLQRFLRNQTNSLIDKVTAARRDERNQFTETVFLLEPNVKRSPGTLRDIHYLRWLAALRYGEGRPSHLLKSGHLDQDEFDRIENGYEFLLQLRNELHFQAGRAEDVLQRPEQARIASLRKYPTSSSLLPVEQFMQTYFAHTSAIRITAEDFIVRVHRTSWLSTLTRPFIKRIVEGDFVFEEGEVSLTTEASKQLSGNLALMCQLVETARQRNTRINPAIVRAIREELMLGEKLPLDPRTAALFLRMLADPTRLGSLIRQMHELRLLEHFIVGMDHARHLMQFNEYHKYTVDEHSFRVLEQALSFAQDPGPLGNAYRSLRRTSIFHLALLCHDVGKGFAEDHSEVGRRMAKATAQRLFLVPDDRDMLEFLVLKHLLMAHFAFRHDISNDSMVARLAADVRKEEYLQSLYVLSAADLAGVGPGVLNPWKQEVLTELYFRTRDHFTVSVLPDRESKVDAQLRDSVRSLIPTTDEEALAWFSREIESLPAQYLRATPPDVIFQDLNLWKDRSASPSFARGHHLPDQKVSLYIVGIRTGHARGTFPRVSAIFSSFGMNIFSVAMHSLADQSVLMSIVADDPDFAQGPPPPRLESVASQLKMAVDDPNFQLPPVRRRWQDAWRERRKELQPLPTRVEFDTTVNEHSTIVDIFAHDRVGLLHTITKVLADQKLLVHFAKVGAYLDQVCSVFYVTDLERRKVFDPEQLDALRQALIMAIEGD